MLTLSQTSIAELKKILEREQGRPFTPDETEAIGSWLLNFYCRLATGNSKTVFTEVKDDIIKKHTA